MDPVSASMLAAGGMSLAGGLWSNISNLGESKRARQFAERMSGSAYQRAVVDMRLAGINPMLAFSQGGASTPGAPMASVDDAVGPAVASAMHARRLSEEVKLMKQQTANVSTDTRVKAGQEQLNRKLLVESEARTREHDANAELTRIGSALRLLEKPAAEQAARAASGTTGRIGALVRQLFGAGGLSPVVGGAAGAAIGRFSRPATVINRNFFPRR